MPPELAALEKDTNMNANYRRVPTQFGPDTGFEVRAGPPAPLRVWQEAELERLKNSCLLYTSDAADE